MDDVIIISAVILLNFKGVIGVTWDPSTNRYWTWLSNTSTVLCGMLLLVPSRTLTAVKLNRPWMFGHGWVITVFYEDITTYSCPNPSNNRVPENIVFYIWKCSFLKYVTVISHVHDAITTIWHHLSLGLDYHYWGVLPYNFHMTYFVEMKITNSKVRIFHSSIWSCVHIYLSTNTTPCNSNLELYVRLP